MFGDEKLAVFVLFSAVVLTSGCVSNSSANLDKDFNVETTPVDINYTKENIAEQAFTTEGTYNVSADTKTLFNTPVTAFKVNLTSRGDFRESTSNVSTTSKFEFGSLSNMNQSVWPVKTLQTDANATEITVTNESGSTTETVEPFSREELGLSIEAFDKIGLQEIDLLGENSEGALVFDVDANRSDLADNYARIFSTHAVNSEQDTEMQPDDVSGFNDTESYLWVDGEDRGLERFAYYGSAADGNVQVRIDANFTER